MAHHPVIRSYLIELRDLVWRSPNAGLEVRIGRFAGTNFFHVCNVLHHLAATVPSDVLVSMWRKIEHVEKQRVAASPMLAM